MLHELLGGYLRKCQKYFYQKDFFRYLCILTGKQKRVFDLYALKFGKILTLNTKKDSGNIPKVFQCFQQNFGFVLLRKFSFLQRKSSVTLPWNKPKVPVQKVQKSPIQSTGKRTSSRRSALCKSSKSARNEWGDIPIPLQTSPDDFPPFALGNEMRLVWRCSGCCAHFRPIHVSN